MARKRNIDPDRILDAAERVVLKHGVQAVTLDLVAAEAAISKGGLTYNFASKEAMLSALLARDVARYWDWFAVAAAQTDATFPELRALLEACRVSKISADRTIGPLQSAIVHAPESLKSAQAFIQWMLSKLPSDSEDGRRAQMVFFAVQGLVLLQALQLLSLTAAKRKAMIEDFMQILAAPAR